MTSGIAISPRCNLQHTSPKEPALLSYNEVQRIAKRIGVVIHCQKTGPFYCITLASGKPHFHPPNSPSMHAMLADKKEIGRNHGIYGYSSGFVVPFMEYMHCDKIEIYRDEVRKNPVLREYRLWLGILMGMATFTHGLENGCLRAEALAVNDNDITHRRLQQFYAYFGFEYVREVTGGLGDLFEMLVWGAVGTRLSADVREVVRKWSRIVRLMTMKPRDLSIDPEDVRLY